MRLILRVALARLRQFHLRRAVRHRAGAPELLRAQRPPQRLAEVAVSATKSVHGHTLGAAGSLEAVATLLALRNSLLPPTINFTTLDPECPLDIVANAPRAAEVEYALSNSFAFGGLNASLAFRRL